MTASPVNTSMTTSVDTSTTTILIIEVKKLTSQVLDTIKNLEARSHFPVKIIPICEVDKEKGNVNIASILDSLKKKSELRVIHVGKMYSQDQESETIEMLRNKIVLSDFQVGDLISEIDTLLNDINAIKSSTSWRITAPIRKIKAMIQFFFRVFRYFRHLHKGISFYRTNGASATIQRVLQIGKSTDYQKWVQAYSTISKNDRNQISAHIEKMTYNPLISILLPVYNTPEPLLRAAIESVQNQIYGNWELCIADDASTLPFVRTVLEAYKVNDSRIKLVFREKNGHISACSNSALSLVTGEFTALLDHDDTLAPHALYMVAQELNQFSDADILYSDEDKIDQQGQRFDPHFKPDWNPELFFSINYLSHLGVYRTRLMHLVNGFREGIEGSQDYDLALRCLQQTNASKIRHIPHVLYHWRASEGSTALDNQEKGYATGAGVQALKDYFSKTNPDVKVSASQSPTTYRVHYPLESEPQVCLIIPTKNNHKLLKICLDSIIEKTQYHNYKILIVNNQSDNPATLAYLRSLKQKPQCKVISYDHAFNYSAINNFAVSTIKSELIALLNDDIEVISPDWLREMVSHAIQPDVGAVGAKLLYPDNRVQHAGVILGLGGVAGHAHKYMDGTDHGYGYFHRLLLPQAVSAVTGACLLVRQRVYEEVGGLDHLNLAVAFNDVDFCLRIRKAGYRNIWTPHALLYHHESVSRGYEDTREKQERFSKEVAYMKKEWGGSLKKDPYYNPNLSMASENFSLGFPSRARKPWQGQA